VVEDPSDWMKLQATFTYLPCLSRSVSGCAAVVVNIGEGEVECVRVRIPLEEPGPRPRTVTYQLGGHSGTMGGWEKRDMHKTQLVAMRVQL
jgi:hypothetical protein